MTSRTIGLPLACALALTTWLAGCKPSTPPAAANAPSPVAAASTVAPAEATAPVVTAAAPAAGGALYKVSDGYKVDAETMKGFRTWRAAACDRCHGPNQEGMVGPSLITSLKTLSKDEFVATVTKGRLEKGMPSFATSQNVIDNVGPLYAYLKGRSDGAITRAKVEELPS